ncbi:MAG TPA: DUF433 domain-containing protein [Thermoanaerobaculia bacterium]|jgi:uncharacterized protein (DUF433 family)
MEDLLSRITVNPKVMVGKPTIRGLRITVEQLLRAMAAGLSEDELLREYPELEKEDLRAVLAYALELVDQEQVHPLAMPA